MSWFFLGEERITLQGVTVLQAFLPFCAFGEVRQVLTGVYSRRRALVIAALAAACFCLVINSSWKATPDSALYLELGESLAHGKGFVFNGQPHTYVPPGYPAMVAVVAWLGDGFLGYRALMALLGLLTAGVGYLFLLRLCGPDTALVAGGLFALNHTLLLNATYTASDVPFALFALLTLHWLLSAASSPRPVLWAAAAGILAGLTPLIRINGWGIPPAGVIFLFFSLKSAPLSARFSRSAVFLLLSLAPSAIWAVHKASYPVSYHEGTYLGAVSGRDIETQVSIILKAAWEYVPETTYLLTGASIKTGVLELILAALVLAGAIAAFRLGERLLVPLTLIQYCGLLLSPAGSRYLLMLIPGLYLFLALGIKRFSEWLSQRVAGSAERRLEPRRVLVVCFGLLGVLNVGANAITITQARTPLEAGGAETERDAPFFMAARWLRENGSGGTVMTMHPRVIRYLSGLPTVELIRSGVPEREVWINRPEQIQELILSRRPTYLFSDQANTRVYEPAFKALEGLNLAPVRITEAGTSSRFGLWRIGPAP